MANDAQDEPTGEFELDYVAGLHAEIARLKQPAESAPTSEALDAVERILDAANLLPLTGPRAIAAARTAGEQAGYLRGLREVEAIAKYLNYDNYHAVYWEIRALIDRAAGTASSEKA